MPPKFAVVVPKCVRCNQSAYPTESVQYDGSVYHQTCFKCLECKMALTLSRVAQFSGDLYCKTCFVKIFKTAGRYTSFGGAAAESRRATVSGFSPSPSPQPGASNANANGFVGVGTTIGVSLSSPSPSAAASASGSSSSSSSSLSVSAARNPLLQTFSNFSTMPASLSAAMTAAAANGNDTSSGAGGGVGVGTMTKSSLVSTHAAAFSGGAFAKPALASPFPVSKSSSFASLLQMIDRNDESGIRALVSSSLSLLFETNERGVSPIEYSFTNGRRNMGNVLLQLLSANSSSPVAQPSAKAAAAASTNSTPSPSPASPAPSTSASASTTNTVVVDGALGNDDVKESVFSPAPTVISPANGVSAAVV